MTLFCHDAMKANFHHNQLIVIIFLIFTLNACSSDDIPAGKIPTEKSKPRVARAHLVEVAQTQIRPLRFNSTRIGTIRARKLFRVFSQEPGKIEQLPLYEGDAVKRDALLLKIDDTLLRAELNKASAKRKQAQLNLNRIKKLAKQQLSAEEELAQANTDMEVASAEERVLQTKIAHTLVRAPFDGVVSARLAEPGDYVASHAHILTLIDPASLVIELAVSELLLPHLNIGDKVDVRIDALGEESFDGAIVRIHPVLESNSRRGRIEIALLNVPAGARAGQLARTTIHTEEKPRLVIPQIALRRDRQGEYVFVVEGNSVSREAVNSGLRFGDWLEIHGLKVSQQVVTRGFLGLRKGKKVTVVAAKNDKEVTTQGAP